MSNKKINHWNIDPIESEGALINIVYGERSGGKSYQTKHKRAILKYLYGIKEDHYSNYNDKEKILTKCIEEGTRFILIRRLESEITSEKIEGYFADVDIAKLTDDKYNTVIYYRKTIYLANYNVSTGKSIKGDKIGYVIALSVEQNYAGVSYLDVTDVIMEEFMSRKQYLPNEPAKLINFWNTVDRKRGTTRLWLLGNSLSRVCPYINDWELRDIFRSIKQGEIKTKWLDTGGVDEETGKPIEVKVAVEWCRDSGNTSFAIGKHKDMLNKGSWQTDPQPHLPKSYSEYEVFYRIMFVFQEFKFVGEFLKDNETGANCWYIYPYNGKIKEGTLVISDQINISNWWQRNIYDVSIKNESLHKLLDTFREQNIFYSSDLCGTDFKQVIDFQIRK